MNRIVLASLLLALPALVRAADEPAGPLSAREMLRARLAEEAKAKNGKPAPGTPAAAAPITETAKAIVEGTEKNPIVASPGNATADGATKTEAKKEPATVLPKMEVKKHRITELDQQLAKQDEAIAREKKNTKPSEMDKALNDEKIAKPLSIFGGESTQYRKQVANQRVALMEDEKDLLEAIAQAKTKEEKTQLQKQLDALRAERRELEKAMR
jgi:hypothetical protein